MNTNKIKILLVLSFTLIGLNVQASTCTFSGDLELGSKGEAVRCLQQYLNNSGYPVSLDGPGSPGKETDIFKDKTKEAVMSWQADHQISPAQGYFGAKSQAKYRELTGAKASSVKPVTPTPASTVIVTPPVTNTTLSVAQLNEQIDLLKKQLASALSLSIIKPGKVEASKRIKEAIDMMDEAADQIQDNQTANITAKENLDDAKEDLYDAVVSYFDEDFIDALDLADDAYKNAQDAYEDAGGKSRDDEVEDMLDEAQDDIDNAENKIEIADDNGKDVAEAEKILESAKKKYDQAETAYDNKDFDKAEELADLTSDLVNDAIKKIGKNSERDEAVNAIDDVSDAINDAEDDINEAEDNDEDIGDADDILDDAKKALKDAKNALGDEEYSDAIDLANEADDLVNEALDEL